MVQKSSQGFINKVGNIIKFALYKRDILDFDHTHCVSDITDFDSHVPQITPSEIAKWGGNSLVSDLDSNISVADPSGTQLISPSSYTLDDLLPVKSVTSIEGENDDLQEILGNYESPRIYRIIYKHGTTVEQFFLYCDGTSADVLRQTLLRTNGFWTRTKTNVWSAWDKTLYISQSDLSGLYSNILNVISQLIGNVNVALAGKSDVGHTHPIEEFPSVTNWVSEQITASDQNTLAYINSVLEKLQKEIDKTVDSYFGKGIPTLENYPASNWIVYDPDTHEEDSEATYAEYSKHEGDTYTNIQNFKKLDINNWEQGIVLADQSLIDVESFTTCKLNSAKAVRYKNLIDYEAGDTLQILSGNTDYMVYVTYFDTYEIFKGYSTYRVSNEDQEIPLSDSYSKCNVSIRSVSEQDITTDIVPDLCLYINSTAGHSWRFCKEVDDLEEVTWSWIRIADSDAIKALLLASEASQKANLAVDTLSDIKSDNVITPHEKLNIRKEWEEIQARYTEVYNQDSKYITSNIIASHIQLLTLSYETLKTSLLGNSLNPESTGIIGKAGEIDPDIMNLNTYSESISNLFKNYYIAELTLMNLITNAGCIQFVDDHISAIVSDSGSIIMTDGSIDSLCNSSQIQYSAGISNLGIGVRYNDPINIYSVSNTRINFGEALINKGGVYSIRMNSVPIESIIKVTSNSISNEQTAGRASASASGNFCIRIINNGKIIYTSEFAEFSINLNDNSGTGTELTDTATATIPQINKVVALSPGNVITEVFGSYEVRAEADNESSECSGGEASALINFENIEIGIFGLEKHCILANDGIGIVNQGALFYIKNGNNSGIQIMASGLPTSDTNLESGQLWVNEITYLDDLNVTKTAKVLCIK